MSNQLSRSEALGIAIQMEQKGIEFYGKAATDMAHPFGKKMFLSLMQDEKRHAEIFRQMAAKAGVRPSRMDEIDKEGPIQRIREVFCEVARVIRGTISPQDDDIKVINIAKDLEAQAYDFYIAATTTVSDPKESEIFRKIADEENQHWRILDDTLLYLTNPAEWHLKEEKPLIDGG